MDFGHSWSKMKPTSGGRRPEWTWPGAGCRLPECPPPPLEFPILSPEAPFHLAPGPVTRRQVGLSSRPADWWKGTWAEAHTICEELGLALPTALHWECGLRGPDGRRWPWGMGGEGWGCSAWGPNPYRGKEWVAEGGAIDLDWRVVKADKAALRPLWP